LLALDKGERAALALGLSIHADLILMDDRKGVAVAMRMGFEVTGTLGILTRAAQRGLVDLTSAIAELKRTNFHCRQEMLDDLLKRYGQADS